MPWTEQNLVPWMVLRRYLLELMKKDIKPRDIMTRAAFENAMVLVMATGGSTNAGGCTT